MAMKHGSIELDEKGWATVRYEKKYNHTIERVWKVLTDPDDLFGLFGTVDLRVGGELTLDIGHGPDPFEILEVEPPRLLHYRGYNKEFYSGLLGERFELIQDGDGCILIHTTTIGPKRPAQLRILCAYHHGKEFWEKQLDGTTPAGRDPGGRTPEGRMPWKEQMATIAPLYIKRLKELYPGWEYEPSKPQHADNS